MYLHLTPYPLDFMVQLLHGPVLPQQKRKQKMIEERPRLKIIRLSGIAALGVVMIGLGGCKHRHSLPGQSEADYDSASPPPPPMAVVVPASMGRSFLRKAGQGSIAYDHSISLTVPTGKVATIWRICGTTALQRPAVSSLQPRKILMTVIGAQHDAMRGSQRACLMTRLKPFLR